MKTNIENLREDFIEIWNKHRRVKDVATIDLMMQDAYNKGSNDKREAFLKDVEEMDCIAHNGKLLVWHKDVKQLLKKGGSGNEN